VAAATARITHYAWPGGVAAIFEASTPCAAVFGAGGWHVGRPDIVFADGPPSGAEAAQLRLPREIVERIASLEFAGAALHTDFVHLGRYLARLEADQASAVLLVLGPRPAVLHTSAGATEVIEPAGRAAGEVAAQARGWIIVINGSLQAQPSHAPASSEAAAPPPPAPQPAALEASQPAAPERVTPDPAPVVPPPADAATGESAPPEAEPVAGAPAGIAAATAAAAEGLTPTPAPQTTVDGAFGRFAGDARYLLSPGAADKLPPGVAAAIAGVVNNGVAAVVLRLLDGAHTLAEIASETGLTPAQVAGVLEALVAHRLAFKYVSRPRPAAGASAGR
jgi:hypothetical protein